MSRRIAHHRIRTMVSTLSIVGIGLVGFLPEAAAGEHAGALATVPGPVRAVLVRVVDARTLVVQANPWPEMHIHTTVRLRGGVVPDEPGAARQGLADLEWRLGRVAGSLWLYDLRRDGDGYEAEVRTGDGRVVR